jgi:ketosteroid isomerase-like protein
MKICISLLILVSQLFLSCNSASETDSIEKWRQEIQEVEHDFAAMADKVGIPDAFIHYAAEDAVLMRNDQLIVGRLKLLEHFGNNPSRLRDEKLSWKPDFVDVSDSGDLAYTYGHYTYTYTDSVGESVEQTGVFHTVWKRQSDGSWRFVWD